jgi:hypothetical protein
MVIDIETVDPNSGFEVCVYPQESRRKRASWILWISSDGSGQLFMNREENGALIGDPIKLPANASRKKVVQIGKGFFDEKTAKQIKDFEKSLKPRKNPKP